MTRESTHTHTTGRRATHIICLVSSGCARPGLGSCTRDSDKHAHTHTHVPPSSSPLHPHQVSGFPQDTAAWKALTTHSSANDHCKNNPNAVDVGVLVDYPRRHCGQNPVSVKACFDDVNYVKPSRAFVFRGTKDTVSAAGAAENVVGLLGQMMTNPAWSIKLVRDQPYGHVIPTLTSGYDGPGECLRHVFDAPFLRAGVPADPSNWLAFDQTEFTLAAQEGAIGFQDQGWVYVPTRCRNRNGQGPGSNPCRLVVRPDTCSPTAGVFAPDVGAFAAYVSEGAERRGREERGRDRRKKPKKSRRDGMEKVFVCVCGVVRTLLQQRETTNVIP